MPRIRTMYEVCWCLHWCMKSYNALPLQNLLYFVSRNPNRVVNWFPIIFKINSDAVKSTFYTMFANDQWPSFTWYLFCFIVVKIVFPLVVSDVRPGIRLTFCTLYRGAQTQKMKDTAVTFNNHSKSVKLMKENSLEIMTSCKGYFTSSWLESQSYTQSLMGDVRLHHRGEMGR